jgi:citrate synthase
MSEHRPERAKIPVKDRQEPFVERPVTQLWQEIPDPSNPFITQRHLCSGYDVLQLAEHTSFTDTLYLLFRCELPQPEQSRLLERLMIGLINPGIRHPAVRAAIAAGAGKSCVEHVLPVGMIVAGGEHGGSMQIPAAMNFLQHNRETSPDVVFERIFASQQNAVNVDELSSFTDAPGFGSRFGGYDSYLDALAELLEKHHGDHSPCLRWGIEFCKLLKPENAGWLASGLVAAVLGDLGFSPKQAAALYQIIVSPGIAAHGIEFSSKPRTAWPFVKDENYTIDIGTPASDNGNA